MSRTLKWEGFVTVVLSVAYFVTGFIYPEPRDAFAWIVTAITTFTLLISIVVWLVTATFEFFRKWPRKDSS